MYSRCTCLGVRSFGESRTRRGLLGGRGWRSTGLISTIGSPRRVTKTAFPLRRTPSRTAEQVVWNLDIGMAFMLGIHRS
jgi:hypothetical protein